MQQCMPICGSGAISATSLPPNAVQAGPRHRGLMLFGPGRNMLRQRRDLWLAHRVLDRLLRPSALIEGVDLHLGDPWLAERAANASGFVLLLPPLGNLSNPFYVVHPRRNDRFVAARAPLRALFPEVDFTPFAFTGHALGVLATTCPERFAEIRHELACEWQRRMQALLDLLPAEGVLISTPQPAFLCLPTLALRNLTRIEADPDDRMSSARLLATALFRR